MDTCIIRCPHCSIKNRIATNKLAQQPQCGKCKTNLFAGMPVEATSDNFTHLINSGVPIVVDFWASWCGPCQQFAPVFSQTANGYKNRAIFAKVNTEVETQLGSQYRIRSIPSLMVFKDGKVVQQLAGALPAGQFSQWLDQVL
ncbi:thioredoxin TrxC [Motilimonas sp. E26]|uniref:thioredoxin TrxC n=1 Tax=Motilimonas sp. E26 TaxID=2865674 RepID=UPI001E4CA090|nr:thioredoxin TrxC [Motilimonas sp. E26]MCE0558430.1 thioredoxin TrxC [Motilimonas sp. E26]